MLGFYVYSISDTKNNSQSYPDSVHDPLYRFNPVTCCNIPTTPKAPHRESQGFSY